MNLVQGVPRWSAPSPSSSEHFPTSIFSTSKSAFPDLAFPEVLIVPVSLALHVSKHRLFAPVSGTHNAISPPPPQSSRVWKPGKRTSSIAWWNFRLGHVWFRDLNRS